MVLFVFPNMPRTEDVNRCLQIALLIWALNDIIRFVFYTFKSSQKGIVAHCRYNLFLVLQPMSVFSECVVQYRTL